jgi:hypothetical protein
VPGGPLVTPGTPSPVYGPYPTPYPTDQLWGLPPLAPLPENGSFPGGPEALAGFTFPEGFPPFPVNETQWRRRAVESATQTEPGVWTPAPESTKEESPKEESTKTESTKTESTKNSDESK